MTWGEVQCSAGQRWLGVRAGSDGREWLGVRCSDVVRQKTAGFELCTVSAHRIDTKIRPTNIHVS